MAIAVQTNAVRYIDIEANDIVNVNMHLDEVTHVKVIYGKSSLVAERGVDYTVTLMPDDFNSYSVQFLAPLITKINALIAADPDEENAVTIRRTLPLTTESTPANVRYTPFLSGELDRIIMMMQQIQEQLDRAVQQPPINVGEAGESIYVYPGTEGALAQYDENGNVVPGPIVNDVEIVAGVADEIAALGPVAAQIVTLADYTAQLVALGSRTAALDGLASRTAAIDALYAIRAEIDALYAVRADIASLGPVAAAIAALDAIKAQIVALEAIKANITTVAGIAANVSTVANIDEEVQDVAAISGAVVTVAARDAQIAALYAIRVEMQAVGDNIAAVVAVNGNAANINTVSANSANITAVAGNAANINAVNANKANIDSVAGNIVNVNNVGNSIGNVNTVAGSIPLLQQVVDGVLSGLDYVVSIAALKAYKSISAKPAVYLKLGARSGVFEWRAGDFSAQIALDTRNGVYVKDDGTAANAGAWVRLFDGRFISAEWFGAVSDLVNDCAPVLQSAIDFAQQYDYTLVLGKGHQYKLSSALTAKHGRSSVDTQSYNFRLYMNGAKFAAASAAQYALTIVPRCTFADRGTGRGGATIEIIGPGSFSGELAATSRGLQIGAAGMWCDNFYWSKLDNLLFENYSAVATATMYVLDSRHIDFTNIVLRTAQLSIACITASSFCGDLRFTGLEISGSTGNRPGLAIAADNATACEVRGLKFLDCTFYGAGYRVTSAQAGRCGDLWFSDCQFDVGVADTAALEFNLQNAASRIFGVHLDNLYFASYSGPCVIFNAAQSQYGIFNVHVSNIQLSSNVTSATVWNAYFVFYYVDGFVIENVVFGFEIAQTASAQGVRVAGSRNWIATGNTGCGSVNIPVGFKIDGDNNYFSVVNNRIPAYTQVSDDTGAVSKIIANNR